MIKPTSITALQIFLFMARTIPLVAGGALRVTRLNKLPLSLPFVRILAIGDTYQQKCELHFGLPPRATPHRRLQDRARKTKLMLGYLRLVTTLA
jgi:hypothetical protein